MFFLKTIKHFYVVTMQRQSSNLSRKSSTSSIKSIGTHDGKFHCDEVLACFMLKLLPTFQDAQIIRTRDTELLQTCDIVVDVGAVYDPETLRFDHHQKSFTETMNSLRPDFPFKTRLSSAGLIYHHYGQAVIAQILDKNHNDEVVLQLYRKMYENFIEEVDAVDNGVPINDQPTRYRVTTTLSHRVSLLNPTWRESRPDEMQAFYKALDMVGTEFKQRVHHYASDWWESFSIVKSAVESRFDVDSSGEIFELSIGAPWKEHLVTLEESMNIETPLKFAIFPDGKGMWRVQGVPVSPESFMLRTPLLADWQGLRGKDLEEASGIPTAMFVHANGFIGGAAERHCAIKMARASLGYH